MWSKVNHWLQDFDQKKTPLTLISGLEDEQDKAVREFRQHTKH